MQSPQAKLKDITRLLASWPSAPGEGDEQLRSYLLAVEDYPAPDVTAAVDALIKGVAPGTNPSFLPVPAVVGAECRRQNHLRAEADHRERQRRPALPAPLIEHSPESQARVRQMAEGFARVAENMRTEDATKTAERERRQDKLDARFRPPQDDQSVMRRLMGYSIGAPESEREAG